MADELSLPALQVPNGFWYVGTPYSRYPGGLEKAFVMACEQVGVLLRAGLSAYSPIAHTHPVAMVCHIDPLDHDIWMPADRPMMLAAVGLVVVKAPGWEASRGLTEEIREFEAAGKPIVSMNPGILPKPFRKAEIDP